MRYFLPAVIVVLAIMSSSATAAVRVASFNIKHLGFKNEKDVPAVAEIVSRFDLVAIQEAMNNEAIDTLERALERKTGAAWGTLTSEPAGRSSYKERYAFAWRESAVSFEGGALQYLDPGDIFAREPLSANFSDKETGQTFTYATVHIVYGDGRRDRRPEIQVLDDYHSWLSDTFGHPVVIAGDFNMPPDDSSWAELKAVLKPMITRGATTLSPTDGRYANLYDNIWLDPSKFDVTSAGIADFPTWLGMTHQEARKRVSDHAPVYVTFGDIQVDASVSQSTGASTQQARTAAARECIDLNSASVSRLDALPQVGPSRAREIVAGRPWSSAGALTKINGLGPSRVRAIAKKACQGL
ncbi:helix-hairpin-helix domain-containing protein [Endozoicomonas sp. G2_2]|nr:helix-hairpin-helix domain-containing protein [Endozoicomonas sp. G2_2]